MLYLPTYNNNNCVVIRSGDVVRVYETRPTVNSNVDYIDYYINSHYINISGVQYFTNTSTLPTCYDNNLLTNSPFYRHDISSILITYFIIVIVCFYFPFKLFSRMFGRWLKI